MNDDWLRQKEKIQFYSEVHISDIYRIDIIWTSKNSKQKNINGRAFSSSMPKAYISFEKNNGEIVNMLILYMNKKTISKMIDCIKQEMIKINNLNLIEETANLVDRFIKPQKLKNKQNCMLLKNFSTKRNIIKYAKKLIIGGKYETVL